MNLPEPIFEAIRSDKLVLWIGAGFSQHRLGLPDWNGLVTEIARRGLEASEPARYATIKTDLEEGRRSAIAVLAELEPFAPAAHALIVEKFLINRERNDPALQDFHTLWDISRKIITTNYDTGLDLARPGKVPKVQPHLNYQLNQLLNQYEGAFYYKLHGCAEEDPGRCILFPNQYDELYRGTSEVNLDTLTDEETPGKFLLKHLIAGHTILFIGFGMEPAARYMLEYGQRLLGDLGRPHFRIVQKGADNKSWPFVDNWEIDSWDDLPDVLTELAREKQRYAPPPFRGAHPQSFELPYVGREADVAHLNEFFRDPAQNFRFLHGMGGVGKSHLLWTVWQTLDTQPVYYRLGPADSLEGLALELGYGDIALLPPPAKTKAFLDAAARERQPMVFDDFYEVRDPHLYRALLDLRNIPGIKTLLISRSLPPDFIGVDVRDKAREITDLPREAFFNCLRGFHQKVFADKYDLTEALLDTCWEHCRGYPLGGQFLLGLKEFDPDFDLSLTHIGRLDLESDPEREGFMTRLLDVILQKGTEAERRLAREAAAFTEPLPQRVYERLPAWDKTAFHTLWRRKHLFFQQAGGLFGAHPLVRTVLESKLGLSVAAHVCAGAYYETLSADDRDLRLSRLQKALYHFDKSRSENDDTHWQDFVARMRPQFVDLNVKQLVDDNAESTIERLQFRLALSPDDPSAMNELGMAFRRVGKLEESIEVLEKAVALGNVQSMNELGKSYREAKQLGKSIAVLEKAVIIQPDNVRLLNELGISYREAKELGRSIAVLEKAVEMQPNNVILLNELGISYRATNDLSMSISVLEKAVNLGSISSMNELGISYREAKDLTNSIIVLEKAVGIGSVRSMNELGISYREVKNLAKSIAVLEKAVEIQPGNAILLNELGISYREAKDLAKSIAVLEKAVKIGNVQSMNELGISYRQAKDLVKSIAVLEKAVELGNIISMNELGISYREAKDLAKSIMVLKTAVELGNTSSMNELGISYRGAKDFVKSIEILIRAVELGNTISMNELGISYREAKDLAKSIEILEMAVELGNTSSMNELGISYREAKEIGKSIEVLEKAVELGSVQSMNELGISYREAKDLAKSILILEKAVKLGNIQSINELARSLREDGQVDLAIVTLNNGIPKHKQPSYLQFTLLQIYLFFKPDQLEACKLLSEMPPGIPGKSTRETYTQILDNFDDILNFNTQNFRLYRLYLQPLLRFHSWHWAVEYLEKLITHFPAPEFHARLGLALSQPVIGREKEGLPMLKEALQQLEDNPKTKPFFQEMALGFLEALYHHHKPKELRRALAWLEPHLSGLEAFEVWKPVWEG